MENACVLGGTGVVGRATMLSFGITKQYSRSSANITLEEVADCRYIFVCLPTPTINGKCFTKDIVELIRKIEKYPDTNDRMYIIRSTVYPGFSREVQERFGIHYIVSNPEFLSNDTWEEDATKPMLIVLGADNPIYTKIVEGIYVARFKYITPVITDSITAETIKLVLNNFFALKVMFGNEIFDFAQKAGANYETIRKVLESHPWGSKNHFQPFYKEKRGIHGKCLPKDTEAFARVSGSKLMQAVHELNQQYL